MRLEPSRQSRRELLKAIAGPLASAVLLAACTASGTAPAPEAGLPAPAVTGSTTPAPNPLEKRTNVKVTLLLPLSSSAGTKEVAQGLKQAGELALLEFDNPAILLTTKDTKGTPEGARAAAEEAVRAGAEILLGPLFAREVQAVAPVARAARVPVIAFSSDQAVAGNGVYLLSFLAGQDVARVVGYAASQGRKSFVALVPDGVYGKVVEQAFREAVPRHGGRIVAIEPFPANANGMLEPVKRIKEAIVAARQAGGKVDALFIPAGQDTLPALAPLIPYNDIDPREVKLIGTSDWDFANIGREAALSGGWYPAPDPKGWADFSQRYAKAYGGLPPRLASLAYDAVSLAVSLSGGEPGRRFGEANLTRPSGFAGVDGLFRLKPNGTVERGFAVLEVLRFGANVVDAAPTAFGASEPALSGSEGPRSSALPRLNLGAR